MRMAKAPDAVELERRRLAYERDPIRVRKTAQAARNRAMLNLTPAVQQAVHDAIAAADIPAGKRGAFVLVADETGTHAILAARLDDRWTIRAGFQHDWHGGAGAEAEVKAVW